MATAAVISFEETREAFAKTRARQQLHEQLDRWLDGLEAHMPADPPSLEELTQAVFAMRQELTGKITEALVAQQHGHMLHQRTMSCPQCHRLLPARPAPPRTVHTMVGEVSLSRPYFYCISCQQGFSPLDDALQLSERRSQWDLQKAAARLAVEVPFGTAEELFTELTGLSLSDHTIHAVAGELSQELGVLEVSPTAAEVAHRVAAMAAGKTWRPVLVLAIDGAFVPTRPEQAKGPAPGCRRTRAKRASWQGEWKEAKGFRFYLVDKERIVHLLSWYQVGSDEEVGAALRHVKSAGLIPEDQVRLCVLGDGAKWIWNQVKLLFPTAVQILDYYHCREHVHKVGSLQFVEDAVQEQEWVEAMMARLFWGYVDWAIEGLKALQPRDTQAAEEIRKLIGFLRNSAGRLHYRTARKGGYPIGSGGIEAANKCISHVRLKRSGAWWYLEKANQMLALRCATYNGTFERVFEVYKRKALQRHGGYPL
ncbi:MAG: ISKra4 family transposase [Polaromonas sp.]